MELQALNGEHLLCTAAAAAAVCNGVSNGRGVSNESGVRKRQADAAKSHPRQQPACNGSAHHPELDSSNLPSYEEYMRRHPEARLLGLAGKWYCIKNFVAVHPGGDVIEKFVGKDATPVFKAFHDKDVLKRWRPVAAFETDYSDPAAKEFEQLHKYFIDKGFFDTSLLWYFGKVCVAFAFLIVSILLITCADSVVCHCLAGVALAGFWQQSGFFLHDFMHNECFHNRKLDSAVGTFFGTVCVGVNSRWWQEEHYVHHALTNTVDYDLGFYDPQMREELWAQHSKLFPFFRSKLEWLAIRCQHITFMPLCTIFGRFAIIYYGFLTERRLHLWIAEAIHFAWMISLFSYLPSWQQICVTYFIAQVLEGVLHIQLLISHYCKTWFERKDICEGKNWYRMQIEANVNIVNPVWFDWFHGGLNFHIEHHLFPLMPRNRYREASRYIKASCAKVGIEYDECGWWEAICRTLGQLRHAARHFTLDPR